jgi:putative DNA primase/helicase
MDAEQLAKALGAVRSGRQWKCKCIAHEDHSPSMIIFDGHTGVQVRCMAGCEPRDIIEALRIRSLWDTDEPDRTPANTPRMFSRETNQQVTDRREQMLRVLARGIFDEAVPIKGTLAQRYFESRDLWSVAREIDDIRFHPRCHRENREQPAVVIAMRSILSHAVTAVQRIFLTRQGTKDSKMMLGSAGGAAMQLQPKSGKRLHIAEGPETALGVIAQDHSPTWALGSTSLIQTFPVLDDIDELVIWADHDPVKKIGGVLLRAGERAALICGQRWRAAGKSVDVFKARIEGRDEADVWSARNARL